MNPDWVWLQRIREITKAIGADHPVRLSLGLLLGMILLGLRQAYAHELPAPFADVPA